MSVLYILGASDPEMAAIEGLLAGLPVAYATVGGRRVTRREAYEADGIHTPSGIPYPHPSMGVVLVECGGPVLDGLDVVARCDHHHPGDVGHGRPPEEFLAASSLGQVIAHLADEERLGHWPGYPGEEQAGEDYLWRRGLMRDHLGWVVAVGSERGSLWYRYVPRTLVLVAAADHCLAAAYAGGCPGVDPEELLRYRAAERGEWLARGPGQGRDEARREIAGFGPRRQRPDWDEGYTEKSAEDFLDSRGAGAWTAAVLAAVESTRAVLRAQALTVMLPIPYVVLREDPVVAVLDLRDVVGTLPELRTAAAIEGVAVLYRMVPPPGSRDQRVEVGIIGAGEGSLPGREPIEAFLGHWAPAQGLTGLYGDAARGFCGGYQPQ